MRSGVSMLIPNAFSNRKAISGDIDAFAFDEVGQSCPAHIEDFGGSANCET